MPNVVTASPTYYGHRLGSDDQFIIRVQQVITSYALTVMAEALNIPKHAERVTLAKQVLSGNSLHYARVISLIVVNHANINGTITISDASVSSSASDAQLLAAVTAQWNIYAGIESGS